MIASPGIVHATPGRVRYRVDAGVLVGRRAEQLEASLRKSAGVIGVRMNRHCRSVAIQFDSGVAEPDTITRRLQELIRQSSPGQGEQSPSTSSHGSHRSAAAESSSAAGSSASSAASRSGSSPRTADEVDDINDPSEAWHTVAVDEVLSEFRSDQKHGLSGEEARRRLARSGANALAAPDSRSNLEILADQFLSLPVGLLAVSAGFSVATGGVADAVVILGVVGLNATIGYVTESQAETTITGLLAEDDPSAHVIRRGEKTAVPAEEIVPGDVLALTPGSQVSADARLLSAERLTIDESALTGESMPIGKSTDAIAEPTTPLRDRTCMVYRGTVVTGGSGSAVVTATGTGTEVGRVQTLVGEARAPETPVQRQLQQMGTTLGIACGGVCVGVFGLGLLRGYGLIEMLKTATSLAVAAVPEGLPMVATTTLALGVNRMRRMNVAIRHLAAVETLGSVQVFCLDKTGTLTINRMTVTHVFAGGREYHVDEDGFCVAGLEEREGRSGAEHGASESGEAAHAEVAEDGSGRQRRSDPAQASDSEGGTEGISEGRREGGRNGQPRRHDEHLEDARADAAKSRVDTDSKEELVRLAQVAALCSETSIVTDDDGGLSLDGSPTENALVNLSRTAGIDVAALRRQAPRLDTEYRTESRRYMTTVHELDDGRQLVAVKGQPNHVLNLCAWQIRDGERVELTAEDRANIETGNARMAGRALRVLGLAYREVCDAGSTAGDPTGAASTEENLTWLGLAGIADPVRPGMKELMKTFHRAGIQTTMITGDQSATAQAIGRELDLGAGKRLELLDSSKLQELDPDVLKSLAQRVHVFSAINPSQKLAIVQALQRAGLVVAMTGDGINDGPARKAADIGVAMGQDGAEVARRVSDVVLEDDNLHTMAVAIRQGRGIYANTRKAIHYLLSTNLSEITVMTAAVAAGTGRPLNAMQLLWLNLVSDIFPVLALAVQPPEEGILDQPPRDPHEPFLKRSDYLQLGVQTLSLSAGTMACYGWGISRYGIGPRAGTMAFMSLTCSQLLHMLSARNEHHTIFDPAATQPDRRVGYALAGGLGLQMASLLVPGLRRLLGNVPISAGDFAVSTLGAGLPFLANETLKPLIMEFQESQTDPDRG